MPILRAGSRVGCNGTSQRHRGRRAACWQHRGCKCAATQRALHQLPGELIRDRNHLLTIGAKQVHGVIVGEMARIPTPESLLIEELTAEAAEGRRERQISSPVLLLCVSLRSLRLIRRVINFAEEHGADRSVNRKQSSTLPQARLSPNPLPGHEDRRRTGRPRTAPSPGPAKRRSGQ